MTHNDRGGYRGVVLARLSPGAHKWALSHDDIHGIGYALKEPVAVEPVSDDPDDDRKAYMVRVKRRDLGPAIQNVNGWIGDCPHGAPGANDAHEFVSALSREGLFESADPDSAQ